MAKITITIPDAKVTKALEGLLTLYPNNETIEVDGVLTPKYTDLQWIDRKVKQIILQQIQRGLEMKAQREATVNKDNDIIQ